MMTQALNFFIKKMVGLMADFIDTREEIRKNLMMREKIVIRKNEKSKFVHIIGYGKK